MSIGMGQHLPNFFLLKKAVPLSIKFVRVYAKVRDKPFDGGSRPG